MANLQNWKNQASDHWKEFQPKRFAELKKTGKLASALDYAAEQTFKEMDALLDKGFKEHEAWEIVRESYLFPTEEGSAVQRRDSPLWSPSEPATLTDILHASIKSGTRTMEIPEGMPRNAQEFKDALKDELK